MAHLKNMINQLIEELNVKIIYRSLPLKGKAIVSLKLIIVNKNLSLIEQEQVILHELEHIKYTHCQNDFESPINKIKKEAQAEYGRIKIDVEHYITNTPKEYWNSFNFLNYFGIGSEYENYVNEQFKNFLSNNKK